MPDRICCRRYSDMGCGAVVMKTEQEARKCWCPFARHSFATDRYTGEMAIATAGRMENKEIQAKGCNCIASGCMAWRWNESAGDTERREFSEMGRSPSGEGWTCVLPDAGREAYVIKSRWERPNLDKRGHCGLAGKV